MPGARSAARRPGRWPAPCCSTRCSARSAPRTSRSATWRCARAWCSTSSSATASTSARSTRSPTCAGGRRSSWPSAAAGKPSTRSRSRAWRWRIFDGLTRAARPRRPRARVARVRGAAARRRQPHQLRAPSPPLVLPDQERRPARLRADEIEVIALVARYHRRGRAEPRATRASTDLPGRLRRTVRVLGRHPAPRRVARPQPPRR